jgi:hypothetical protein
MSWFRLLLVPEHRHLLQASPQGTEVCLSVDLPQVVGTLPSHLTLYFGGS